MIAVVPLCFTLILHQSAPNPTRPKRKKRRGKKDKGKGNPGLPVATIFVQLTQKKRKFQTILYKGLDLVLRIPVAYAAEN